MSEQPETPASQELQKSKTPRSRIILFLILGVAIVVLVFELYAKNQATAAYEKVFKYTSEYEQSLPHPAAVAEEDLEEATRRRAAKLKVREDRTTIKMENVRDMVGKAPSQEADPQQPPLIEIYVWPGFWKHTLKVIYSQASEEVGQPYIIGAELDQKFWLAPE